MSDVAVEDAAAKPAPTLLAIAAAFCWVALASFGGGLSAWSREVVVVEKGWLDDDEFLSAMTLCRVLPGANQVNLAIYVGIKLRGAMGALAAVVGLTGLPVVIVLVLGYLYVAYGSVPAFSSVLRGVTAVAVAMTFAMAYHTGRKGIHNAVGASLCLASFVITAYFRLPLLLMLIVLAPPAMWWAWPKQSPP
jgi:chromate transporter